ncbi:unnamed protein product [Ectocarpus sp. 12 AP-2014]
MEDGVALGACSEMIEHDRRFKHVLDSEHTDVTLPAHHGKKRCKQRPNRLRPFCAGIRKLVEAAAHMRGCNSSSRAQRGGRRGRWGQRVTLKQMAAMPAISTSLRWVFFCKFKPLAKRWGFLCRCV